MSDDNVPDLKSLLNEPDEPPTAHCTVPLRQGIRAQIDDLEDELARTAADEAPKRMGGPSPLKEIAERIEALREQMRASEVTFRFRALSYEQREQIRADMRGRDDQDELNLRAIAAMCFEPAGLNHGDFRKIRAKLGARIFDETIDKAADKASGGDWSVPFSFAASHILGTQK